MAKEKEKEVKKTKEMAEEKMKKKVKEDKNPLGAEKKKAEETKEPKDTAKEEVKEKVQDQSQARPVKLTFHSYIIMLGAIAWQFLGKIPNPQTGNIQKNLMQVKEIIDLLEILEEKTRGNLSKEEDNILKSTLSNLRLNYVEELKK